MGCGLGFAPAVAERGFTRYLDSMSVAGIVVCTGCYYRDRIFNTDIIMHEKRRTWAV